MRLGADEVMEAVYRTRLTERRTVLAAREREHVLLSRLRLSLVALTIATGVIGGLGQLAWVAVPGSAFLVVAVWHARRLDERRKAASAVAFYERGLARLAHEWIGRGEQGDRFRDAAHPTADDLDLFGVGSLFELLATTRTRAGQATLARWLLEPADPSEVSARQSAVSELAPKLDLRESIAILGDGLSVGVDADGLRAWATAPLRLGGARLRAFLAGLVLTFLLVVAWMVVTGTFTLAGWRLLVALVLAEGAVALWLRARVVPVIHRLSGPTRDLELLSDILATLERERFESPRLHQVQAALGRERPASLEIKRLGQLLALLESRRNIIFALPAALLLWATQLACMIEAWRERVGRDVPGWLEALGEFEALVALATFASEHPDCVFPELEADGSGLDARALAHPLLPADAVANDITLGGEGPALFIVSGSNMSGKSTWLRAIGVNVVLAQAGAPVRAAAMRLSPLEVGASMRAADSLVDGRSHFMAEITRLKQIVDLARARRGRVLFLLDEVLAGTNSHDRRHGAEGLLAGLTALGAVGLVTTHDLALGELAGQIEARTENVHFEDVFDGTHLSFDYRLRPGVVKTSNAIALMRSIGLDV